MKKKIDWIVTFIWLVFIPVFIFLSYYGLAELVRWMLYG